MKVKTKKRKSKGDLTKSVRLTLPKDYPWKVLSCLTNDLAGNLASDDKLLVDQIIRDRDHYSLSLLAETWSLQCINSNFDNESIAKMRSRYQVSALLKKYRFNTEKDIRRSNALKKFLEAEDVCQAYNHSGYKALCWGETEVDAEVYSYAKSFLQKVLGEKSPTDSIVTRWSRHGPGSNLDTYMGQSNLYIKYRNWPYSCTRNALPYARYLIQSDARWLGSLENSYRSRFGIKKHEILNMEAFWDNVFKVVDGNRIAFVPKNAQTERSIAIEPTMNLMLQLGVDGHIRSRLKRWDVDLDSQEKNQIMAYRGSINPTDESYVTLDLAMASDTLSLKLCEILLPSEWYSYLLKLRSPLGKIGEETISYEKISSMGNGFTFVLESAIFASLCYGAIRAHKGTCDFRTDMSVYGDDLIVRKDSVASVIRALNNAGFKLNVDKSFLEGFVRESCGTDWIHGKPVRPVFFSDLPTNVMELLVDRNRLKRILSLRWGIEDSETVKCIDKWIPEQFRNLKGPYSNTEFDSYIHSSMPVGSYKNCMWKYKRLIKKPVEVKAEDFLMRKLMHDLRGTNETPKPNVYTNGKRISAGGSRFTVIKSYQYTVGATYSVASYWPWKYNDDLPLEF